MIARSIIETIGMFVRRTYYSITGKKRNIDKFEEDDKEGVDIDSFSNRIIGMVVILILVSIVFYFL